MRMRLPLLIPELKPLSVREHVRSAADDLVGIMATGLISRAALGTGSALPAMIAPMSASAVLLFTVPASPLAQPLSILGGNVVATVVRMMAASVPDPFLATTFAISWTPPITRRMAAA